MSDNNTLKDSLLKKKKGFSFKNRLAMSLPLAFSITFMIIISGVIDIFSQNIEEFAFSATDFMPSLLIIAAIIFIIISAVLLSLRGKAFEIAFSVFAWIGLMSFVQAYFLNLGLNSLENDGVGNTSSPKILSTVINSAIWIAAFVGILFFVMKKRKRRKKTVKLFSILLSVFLTVISSTSLIYTAVSTDAFSRKKPVADAPEEEYILSNKNIAALSENGNVVVFVIDRFDISYYRDVIEDNPDYFDGLDGFTFYDNNISLYSRTFPSVAYMISGIKNDFSQTKNEYFNNAYKNSDFLSDLVKNNYSLNIYTDDYYAYSDTNNLHGLFDNVIPMSGSYVKNRLGLSLSLVDVSLYRYFPNVYKYFVSSIDTTKFKQYIEHYSNFEKYDSGNQYVYPLIKNNQVNFSSEMSENGKKKFTFIHLAGCHTSCFFDEECNPTDPHGSQKIGLKGSFYLINEYLNQMKNLGIYKSSTIIITGDHSAAHSDSDDVFNPRVTALFVKEKGKDSSPLEYSSAPVSHENLFATVIKSEKIETNKDYGLAFSEISENSSDEREYYFEKNVFVNGTWKHDELVVYKVVGNANEFSNWLLSHRINVGSIYN